MENALFLDKSFKRKLKIFVDYSQISVMGNIEKPITWLIANYPNKCAVIKGW